MLDLKNVKEDKIIFLIYSIIFLVIGCLEDDQGPKNLFVVDRWSLSLRMR